MKTNKFFKIIGLGFIVIFLVILIIKSMLVITHDNEYKVIKQFGSIKFITQESGFRFKTPIIQTVSSIPKNTQLYDLPASDVITSDKKTMIVDSVRHVSNLNSQKLDL